jgi:hypothetical protein
MPNYEIKIQVEISPTDQDVISGATASADGSFRVVMSRDSAQSIDQCEQALLAVNYPAIREGLARHLSEMSKQQADYGPGRLKKTPPPIRLTAK